MEDAGRDYHLVVKGFKCGRITTDLVIQNKVTGFLGELFGDDQHSPVKHNYHHLNEETKVLKVNDPLTSMIMNTINLTFSVFHR